jgi:xanthine dehydrogenase small subunit
MDAPDALTIGVTVPMRMPLRRLGGIDPDLGELMRRFGSAQVRASGTVGGNIANGSPIGDLAPALIALGAELELRGPRRPAPSRSNLLHRLPPQDRQPGRIRAPRDRAEAQGGEVFRCYKVSKRFDEDISSAMGAFRSPSRAPHRGARVAFGRHGGTPKRAPETEAALVGASLDEPASWERRSPPCARLPAPVGPPRLGGLPLTVARNSAQGADGGRLRHHPRHPHRGLPRALQAAE